MSTSETINPADGDTNAPGANITPTTGGTHPLSANITPGGVIHADELRRLRLDDPGVPILDVRTASEFDSVHIPGSFNVPLDQLAEHVEALATFDHPVVLVCLSGNRASTAQKKLNEAGKTNLHVLDGGIGAWQAADGEVVRGRQKWSLERQVRGTAGIIALASIVASVTYPKARIVAGAVGFGLAFSALTDTCAMGTVLARLPYNRGNACVIDDVLARMQPVSAATTTEHLAGATERT
jgi:rhodanese-related sulfurtransferase